MSITTRVYRLWRNVRHRDLVERELDDELRATLELLVQEKVNAGFSWAQAHRAAAVELQIEPVKERVRDAMVPAPRVKSIAR